MRDALAKSDFDVTLLKREKSTCEKWLFVQRCWSEEMHAECEMHLWKVTFNDIVEMRKMRYAKCQMHLWKMTFDNIAEASYWKRDALVESDFV